MALDANKQSVGNFRLTYIKKKLKKNLEKMRFFENFGILDFFQNMNIFEILTFSKNLKKKISYFFFEKIFDFEKTSFCSSTHEGSCFGHITSDTDR